MPFDRPFDRLTVLSKVDGLRAMSVVEWLSVSWCLVANKDFVSFEPLRHPDAGHQCAGFVVKEISVAAAVSA